MLVAPSTATHVTPNTLPGGLCLPRVAAAHLRFTVRHGRWLLARAFTNLPSFRPRNVLLSALGRTLIQFVYNISNVYNFIALPPAGSTRGAKILDQCPALEEITEQVLAERISMAARLLNVPSSNAAQALLQAPELFTQVT